MVRKAIATCLAVVLGCWSLTLLAQDVPAQPTTPWFPLRTGSEWTYRSINVDAVVKKGKQEAPREKDPSKQVVIRVDKITTIEIPKGDNKFEKQAAFLLVGSSETRKLSEEYISVKSDGIYRSEGSDKDVTPQLCIFKLPYVENNSWECNIPLEGGAVTGTFKTGKGRERITVPKGTFDAVHVSGDFLVGKQKMTADYWFHEGTGIVKRRIVWGTFTVQLELEGFKEGK